MPELPSLSGRAVVKAFESLGWEKQRQRGSHIILVREGHLATLSVYRRRRKNEQETYGFEH